MLKIEDVTGMKYGRLTAVRFDRIHKKRTYWVFRCDCGKELSCMVHNVKRGNTNSCGCFLIDVMKTIKRTHGHTVGRKPSRTFKAYLHAKGRCFCTTDEKYPIYGGRGITMCAEWRDDFSAFLRDMGEAPRGKTLDRIDVNGNYEPGNCRWATPHEQSRNLRKNIIVEHEGQQMILKDFAAVMGVSYVPLYKRFRRGQTPHEAARGIIENRETRLSPANRARP